LPSIIRIINSREEEEEEEEKRNAHSLLVGKPGGKRLLRRPRCIWVDIIRMDLGEMR
jgi:hypothetical protein